MIKEYLEKIDLPCPTANMNSLEKRNKGLEITQTSQDMKGDKSAGLSGFYLKNKSTPKTSDYIPLCTRGRIIKYRIE